MQAALSGFRSGSGQLSPAAHGQAGDERPSRHLFALLLALFVAVFTVLGKSEPTASAQQGGIILEIRLDRQQVRAGERVFALVRVTNDGDQVPTREENICRNGPALTTVDGNSGLPEGRTWTGLAGEFKNAVVAELGGFGGTTTRIGQFEDEAIDCSDPRCIMAEPVPFLPGDRVEALVTWDVVADPGRVIAGGQATVRAAFTSSAGSVATETSIEIEADSEPERTVVEYVDIALAEPTFRGWLEEQPRHTWNTATISFWPADELGQYPPGPSYARPKEKSRASACGSSVENWISAERSSSTLRLVRSSVPSSA